ncbi:hypothetical protein [Streptomyces sp. NBC_00690]|uniref:hypothetical protein n=1 Tax=Streptomyces sp. NBC_00690 TaxID=2975808 RepID=UPI002E2CE65B|nr:hypothetical protein [Streptomyces sp. NBC_00690]
MRSQDTIPSPGTSLELEHAEAALVEHYPRLVRIAYLVLPPSLSRNRRVLTSHSLVQRSLPRGRVDEGGSGYAYLRARVIEQALAAGLPLSWSARPRRAQLPPLLPRIWGLRVFPRSGGADELALDRRLARLSGPARAAYVLRQLEGLDEDEVRQVLHTAGAQDTDAAVTDAAATHRADPRAGALLSSTEFDPCSLQVRPPDLIRRRQHARAAVVGAAALAVCGALLGMPGEGWGQRGAAAPPYTRNPAAERALDPERLVRVSPTVWRQSSRLDFSVWPARGELAEDRSLLGRALSVWARPGRSVRVSATPATPPGPPVGPAHLLYAGLVDEVRVVLLHDGLRVVRYAEPTGSTRGAALDFARTDGAEALSSDALVVGRTDGNVRYLTAPWVQKVSVRDLLAPAVDARLLPRDAHGVTRPLPSPAQARTCRTWETLEIADGTVDRFLTDLGELTPARLTFGPPTAPQDVRPRTSLPVWASTACLLPEVRGRGVRTVNLWRYAQQPLPRSAGTASWLCLRAETWRGRGSRVLAQFQAPGAPMGAVVARSDDSAACGVRDPKALAGVVWRSPAGDWYVLAAGSDRFTSLAATGGVTARARGRLLAIRARQGTRAELTGVLLNGARVGALG